MSPSVPMARRLAPPQFPALAAPQRQSQGSRMATLASAAARGRPGASTPASGVSTSKKEAPQRHQQLQLRQRGPAQAPRPHPVDPEHPKKLREGVLSVPRCLRTRGVLKQGVPARGPEGRRRGLPFCGTGRGCQCRQ